ncbi:MAG: hypothetical protein QOI85_322 [Chloroflexota bacterium]|nr:hypothetical protein [Chloroflexota bacterium]
MLRHRVASAGPWCSGQTCQPVTLEIAGSNPVGPATAHPILIWQRERRAMPLGS